MLMLDKSFFDYDYERIEKPTKWEDTVKSDEEVADILAMFGLKPKTSTPSTAEDIQNYIKKQIKED